MWQRKLEFQTWYYISNPKKSKRLSKKIRLYLQSLAPCYRFSQRKETFFVNFRLTK